MSRVAGHGGGMVGGGVGGGRGGGWGRGGGDRGNGGHGGDDDDARRALVRSVGAKKRGARKWLNWGMHPPPSLRDYAPGSRYYDHLPPVVHAPAPVVHAPPPPPAVNAPPPGHVYAQDDAEKVAFIAQAIAQSEAAITEMLRRDNEEIAAAMAVFQAREAAERAAKPARVEESVVLDDDE